MTRRSDGRRETLFEFRSIGQQVRVAAIDPETGIEVVIVAPGYVSQDRMKQIALAKLLRRIAQDTGIAGHR